MELFDFFTGKWLNAVDAKGRVSVPAPLRKIVTARSPEARNPDARSADARSSESRSTLMLARHERDTCISGFDRTYVALAYQDMRAVQAADIAAGRPAAGRFARSGSLFGSIEEIAIDGSGRIILPPGLRRRAQISDSAMFVGVGETFEIWSPEIALNCAERPEMAEFAEELIAEREGRL